MTARKVKALRVYGVVRDNGDICLGTVDSRRAVAAYWLKHNGYPKGTARIRALRITPHAKKKGKANG